LTALGWKCAQARSRVRRRRRRSSLAACVRACASRSAPRQLLRRGSQPLTPTQLRYSPFPGLRVRNLNLHYLAGSRSLRDTESRAGSRELHRPTRRNSNRGAPHTARARRALRTRYARNLTRASMRRARRSKFLSSARSRASKRWMSERWRRRLTRGRRLLKSVRRLRHPHGRRLRRVAQAQAAPRPRRSQQYQARQILRANLRSGVNEPVGNRVLIAAVRLSGPEAPSDYPP